MSLPTTQKVLIAEDDRIIGHVYSNVLKGAGFEVVLVTDGLSLLAQYEQLRPNALLVDIMMPGLNGVEAIKAIRAIPTDKPVPILAVTNAFVDQLVCAAKAAGANSVLSKTVLGPPLLIHTIKMLLLPEAGDSVPEGVSR